MALIFTLADGQLDAGGAVDIVTVGAGAPLNSLIPISGNVPRTEQLKSVDTGAPDAAPLLFRVGLLPAPDTICRSIGAAEELNDGTRLNEDASCAVVVCQLLSAACVVGAVRLPTPASGAAVVTKSLLLDVNPLYELKPNPIANALPDVPVATFSMILLFSVVAGLAPPNAMP